MITGKKKRTLELGIVVTVSVSAIQNIDRGKSS